jgi:hypothetical protein
MKLPIIKRTTWRLRVIEENGRRKHVVQTRELNVQTPLSGIRDDDDDEREQYS